MFVKGSTTLIQHSINLDHSSRHLCGFLRILLLPHQTCRLYLHTHNTFYPRHSGNNRQLKFHSMIHTSSSHYNKNIIHTISYYMKKSLHETLGFNATQSTFAHLQEEIMESIPLLGSPPSPVNTGSAFSKLTSSACTG